MPTVLFMCFVLCYKTYLSIVGKIQNELNNFLQILKGNHVSVSEDLTNLLNECDYRMNYLRQLRYHYTVKRGNNVNFDLYFLKMTNDFPIWRTCGLMA